MSGHEVRPSQFRIAVAPEGHPLRARFKDMDSYAIVVEWRGRPYNDPESDDDRWSVGYQGRVWIETEGWVFEPPWSTRTVEFCRVARYPLEEAKTIALNAAAAQLSVLEEQFG